MADLNDNYEKFQADLKKQMDSLGGMQKDWELSLKDLQSKVSNISNQGKSKVKYLKGRKITLFENKTILLEYEEMENAQTFFDKAK